MLTLVDADTAAVRQHLQQHHMISRNAAVVELSSVIEEGLIVPTATAPSTSDDTADAPDDAGPCKADDDAEDGATPDVTRDEEEDNDGG
jgi:hypothetical protein